ncbi:MAG TPA: hypothetical protein VIC57_01275 [Candidatus Dormibacteraeota bacterium]
MNIGVAALISWLLTAAFGGALVLLWTARSSSRPRRRGRPSYGRPPPYIPRSLVVAHVALAVGGLVAWTGALIAAKEGLAYVALGALVVVALLGASMFVRWLGSRRARQATRMLIGAPAESRLPTVMVLGHGLLGVATVVLVVLSWVRG